ncbi:BRO-N domain-containing protein [Campylobacter jejuni]|uniref:BRO-N domain-containing protein n=1 Tax=Campylobacter jejuni TaxID=197 RepID=UPI000773C6E2|nr:BRO family protein [Campylobacter jejuni]EHM2680085.1 hypothetical protein [Campylobacter jejuni]EIA9981034.1 hypothetical protein [Campylobacter jejuni]EID3794341.1 hypothetical protein [Campylobacter jejuni]EIO2454274.1 hypothetical protein [Campylobacter jejuni]EIS7943021.1 hypothetical protein [Campylobacter jejuni]
MNLEIFKKDDLELRVIKDKNNQPLFCLSDVCKILDFSNPLKAKDFLAIEFGEDDVTNIYPIQDSLGTTQNVTFITEPQLYYMIGNSRSKNAKTFRMWANKGVLLLGLELLEKNKKLELENVNLKNQAKENAVKR